MRKLSIVYSKNILLLWLLIATISGCDSKTDEEVVSEHNAENDKVSKKISQYGLDIELGLTLSQKLTNDTCFVDVMYDAQNVHNFELVKEWLLQTASRLELSDFPQGTKYICIEIHELNSTDASTFTINVFDFVEESFDSESNKKYMQDLVYFYRLDGGKTLNEINYLLENASEIGEGLEVYNNNFLNLLRSFYLECDKGAFHYTRMQMLFAWTGATKEKKYFDILNNVFANCGFDKFTIQELKDFMEYLGAPPIIPWEETE